MSAEKLKAQLKTLKQKAKAARKEGKRDVALSFRAGARRAARKLRGLEPKKPAKKES